MTSIHLITVEIVLQHYKKLAFEKYLEYPFYGKTFNVLVHR